MQEESEKTETPLTEFERFAFDGSCPWSTDADVCLQFDDGTTLRAHKQILSLASPVMKDELEKQNEPFNLTVKDVSSRIWLVLLHQLYPIHVSHDAHRELSQVSNDGSSPNRTQSPLRRTRLWRCHARHTSTMSRK